MNKTGSERDTLVNDSQYLTNHNRLCRSREISEIVIYQFHQFNALSKPQSVKCNHANFCPNSSSLKLFCVKLHELWF